MNTNQGRNSFQELETDKSLKIFAVPGSERNHRPIIAKENLYEAKVVTDKQTQTGKVPYVFDCQKQALINKRKDNMLTFWKDGAGKGWEINKVHIHGNK